MFSERNISWYLCEYDGNLKLFENLFAKKVTKKIFEDFQLVFEQFEELPGWITLWFTLWVYIEVNVVSYAHYARC